MKTLDDLLLEHDFFKDIDPDYAELIAGCGQNVHFSPNQYLIKEGEDADYFFVIRKGKVAVEIFHPVRGDLMIQTVGPHGIVGFSWIVPPYKYHFSVKAIEETSAVSIDGKCIRNKCDKDPVLGFMLMRRFAQLMAKRLENTRLQLLDVYAS